MSLTIVRKAQSPDTLIVGTVGPNGKPPKQTEPPLRMIIRLMVAFRSRCALCMREVMLHVAPNHPRRATKDHIVPKSKGGKSEWANYQLACFRCNTRKGDSLNWQPPELAACG